MGESTFVAVDTSHLRVTLHLWLLIDCSSGEDYICGKDYICGHNVSSKNSFEKTQKVFLSSIQYSSVIKYNSS